MLFEKDVNCPYCGVGQDINHDDGYGYAEDTKHKQQCYSCNKEFVYTTSVSYDYDAERADCLNDGTHDWQPTRSFPKFMTKMECTMCDEERKPTADERKKFNIPTYEEYLEETKQKMKNDSVN